MQLTKKSICPNPNLVSCSYATNYTLRLSSAHPIENCCYRKYIRCVWVQGSIFNCITLSILPLERFIYRRRRIDKIRHHNGTYAVTKCSPLVCELISHEERRDLVYGERKREASLMLLPILIFHKLQTSWRWIEAPHATHNTPAYITLKKTSRNNTKREKIIKQNNKQQTVIECFMKISKWRMCSTPCAATHFVSLLHACQLLISGVVCFFFVSFNRIISFGNTLSGLCRGDGTLSPIQRHIFHISVHCSRLRRRKCALCFGKTRRDWGAAWRECNAGMSKQASGNKSRS